jgi:hypothetical protein
MSNLSKLPIDLIFEIRGFLHFISIDAELNATNPLERFARQDSQASWRNFISCSKGKEWKWMRMNCMIWSLNRYSSLWYLTDEHFRRRLLDGMICPRQQLQLQFTTTNNSIMTKFKIPLDSQVIIQTELSLFGDLHSLALQGLSGLTTLENCGNLRALSVVDCPSLLSLGNVDNLLEVSLSFVSDVVLESIPFEKLEKLFLTGYHHLHFIDRILPRLNKSLKELRLYIQFVTMSEQEYSFSGSSFPNLESLQLVNFSSVYLNGLTSLRHLHIRGTKSHKIIGKENLYPILKQIDCDYLSRKDFLLLQNNDQLRSLRFLSVEEENEQTEDGFKLQLGQAVKSLHSPVSLESISGFYPGRKFDSFTLNYRAAPSWSSFGFIFQSIQKVSIWNCSDLTNISCLKNVPFLSLRGCQRISDFSALGNQSYLDLMSCYHVSDKDVERFGNVSVLNISFCAWVSKIVSLMKIRRLYAFGCGSLRTVSLTSNDIVSAILNSCSKLSTVNITGSVFLLDVTACDQVKWEEIKNYELIRYSKKK